MLQKAITSMRALEATATAKAAERALQKATKKFEMDERALEMAHAIEMEQL